MHLSNEPTLPTEVARIRLRLCRFAEKLEVGRYHPAVNQQDQPSLEYAGSSV